MDKKEIEELFKKANLELESRLKNSIKAVIKEEFEQLVTSRLSVIEDKLKEIEKSQSFLSEQYESFRNQVGHVLAENTQIKAENESLVARIRNLEKFDKQRVKALDDLEQYGRGNMVEVGGIPRQPRENCEEIILKIASKINVDLKPEDIEACHRISPKPDAPIIVKVISRKTSVSLMSKTAKANAKKITIADLGYEMPAPSANSTGKVYINESLTGINKNLLRLSKIKKRELDFKFVWSRNGAVFMRRDENAPIKKIFYPEDLESLVTVAEKGQSRNIFQNR
eukprot:gene20693-22730_t